MKLLNLDHQTWQEALAPQCAKQDALWLRHNFFGTILNYNPP